MGSNRDVPKFRPSDPPLEMLVKLSRYYGSDPEIVLAGGGNTSVKIDDVLYVKASGQHLGTIDAGGFVALDRKRLDSLLEKDFSEEATRREEQFKEEVLAARVEPEKSQRPSVECVLHNLLPCKFVVHTHPTLVNILTCCTRGEKLVGEMFGEEVLWMHSSAPGLLLGRALGRGLQEYSQRTGRQCPDVVLIQNHGLVVCGEEPGEVCERMDRVLKTIRKRLQGTPKENVFGKVARVDSSQARSLINTIGPALRGLLGTGENLKVVTFDDSDDVMNLVGGPDGPAAATGGALTPDHIVYCTSLPLWFQTLEKETPGGIVERVREAVRHHQSKTGFAPNVVLVERLGMFAAGDDFSGADTVRLVYINAIKVLSGARRLGGINYMTPEQREFVETWEAEAYRRTAGAGMRAMRGRAVGKVAVVTGAARGFGLEIARDLVAQGGHVVLTDINSEGVCEAASELDQQSGEGRALGLVMDVTDGESIVEAIHQVVRTYGGFDVLVCNAGVLQAGSVKTQPPSDFDLVTSVNYKGYFLCVQNAVPILSIQHLSRPDYLSDIIQINSKSGLVGSERNSAYAGSKFGAIGLTQSFALELIADGIKVNSICPGNYFDGPLWSDPETGLFVQYLRAGKVPGAKTVEDVRRAYEEKIPLRRGCRPADVMKAIYYIMEQKYETGQAVPVTGGQVMLR